MNTIDKIRERIKELRCEYDAIDYDPKTWASLGSKRMDEIEIEKNSYVELLSLLEKDCPDCKDGSFRVKMTMTSPLEKVKCPKCKGTGKVNIEHEKDELIKTLKESLKKTRFKRDELDCRNLDHQVEYHATLELIADKLKIDISDEKWWDESQEKQLQIILNTIEN